MLENNELVLDNQDELIVELKALSNGMHDGSAVTFKAYTVAEGDSLSEICTSNKLDYESTYKLILALNRITDANQIYVGQTILLPVAE